MDRPFPVRFADALFASLLAPGIIVNLITIIVAAMVEIVVIPFLVLRTGRIGGTLAGLGG
jgi:hypothetical protein